MKQCPYCAAIIGENARYCVHCMRELEGKTQLAVKRRYLWHRWCAPVLALLCVVGVAAGCILLWPDTPARPTDQELNQKIPGTAAIFAITTTATTTTAATTTTTTGTPSFTSTTTDTTLDGLDWSRYWATHTTATPTGGYAGYGVTWEYEYSTDTLIFRGNGEITGGDWGYHRDTTRHVIVENGITSLCSSAFFTYTYLETVALPDTLKSIGPAAFGECHSLQEICLPRGLESIGASAFEFCGDLNKVINRSALPLQIGSTDYGYVAYYASEIIVE